MSNKPCQACGSTEQCHICGGPKCIETCEKQRRRIAELEASLAEETRLKCEYFAKWQEAERKLAEHQRWEIGFRNIVTIVTGAREDFEIPEIVEIVRSLKQDRERLEWLISTLNEMELYGKWASWWHPDRISTTQNRGTSLEWRANIDAAME